MPVKETVGHGHVNTYAVVHDFGIFILWEAALPLFSNCQFTWVGIFVDEMKDNDG